MARPAWLVALVALFGAPARADEHSDHQERITGREDERRLEGDAQRDVADGLLFVPREALHYLLLANLVLARFAHDRQLAPTTEQVEEQESRFVVFPTLFAETERHLSVGLRMVTIAGNIGTSHRVGFGGVRDLVAESEIQWSDTLSGVPLVFAVEGLAESKTELEYFGVGQTPRSDARNRFVAGTGHDHALYDERRSRGILSAGVRPVRELQLLASTSLTRRQIDEDAGDQALSRVFEPGSVPSWGFDGWLTYTELALRVDTRAHGGAPLPGFMAETYGGYAREAKGIEMSFARTGGRLAGFVPIYRSANLLSPKLALDGLAPIGGRPLPFTELVRQPDYRGADTRRDRVSLLGSLDYIWAFTPYAAARLFVDAATVGPSVDELALEEVRVAGGGGFDLHTRDASLARLWLAGSADGAHVHVSLGTPSHFGDRQHGD